VDALNERTIETYLDGVVKKAGKQNISFNAFCIPQEGLQGTPLTDTSLENFLRLVNARSQKLFLTAHAAAKRMLPNHSRVILMHTPQPSILGSYSAHPRGIVAGRRCRHSRQTKDLKRELRGKSDFVTRLDSVTREHLVSRKMPQG
jgi:hypothetical protein